MKIELMDDFKCPEPAKKVLFDENNWRDLDSEIKNMITDEKRIYDASILGWVIYPPDVIIADPMNESICENDHVSVTDCENGKINILINTGMRIIDGDDFIVTSILNKLNLEYNIPSFEINNENILYINLETTNRVVIDEETPIAQLIPIKSEISEFQAGIMTNEDVNRLNRSELYLKIHGYSKMSDEKSVNTVDQHQSI